MSFWYVFWTREKLRGHGTKEDLGLQREARAVFSLDAPTHFGWMKLVE